MHSLPFEIECVRCGCVDCEVERVPKADEWFPIGVARCNECGCEFSFRTPTEKEMSDNEVMQQANRGAAQIYHPLRCPACRSKDVPVQHTAQRVRYHKCRDCGATFKSVERQ